MKNIFSGFCTAFSMYSMIPVPNIEWNKSTMKYAMCFFPLVGAVIGIIMYILNILMRYFNCNILLYSGIMTAVPVLISGAIHLDGFIDTSDARYSRQEREKKLEILKDPHVGAFGVISCCVYLMVNFAVMGQLYDNGKNILILSLGYILTRALSGISVVSFKTAKNTGLAHIFSDNADKKTVRLVLTAVAILDIIGMIALNPITGGLVAVTMCVYFFLYKRMCIKEFGGITGDLAGYFLVISELLILIIATIGGFIC